MQELKKKFYKRFLLEISILGLIVIVLILSVVTAFGDGDKEIGILLAIFLAGMQIFLIRQLIVYLLDWHNLKTNTVKRIKGSIIKIKIVEEGGDVVTFARYPIVREDVTGKEYVMKIDNVRLGEKYTFLFLKHTKMAVVEKSEMNF